MQCHYKDITTECFKFFSEWLRFGYQDCPAAIRQTLVGGEVFSIILYAGKLKVE